MSLIRLQESLLGEVNRVQMVDNQRSSGVTVVRSESVLVRSLDRERRVSTNRCYHTYRKIGLSLHQVVSETLLPVRYNFVFPFRLLLFLHTYSPQKAKKIYIVTYSLSYSLIVPCNFVSVSCCWVCALGQVLVAGFISFLVQFVFSPLFFIIIREHLQVLLSLLCIHQTLVHAILFVTLVFTVFIKSLLPWPILRTLLSFCPLIRNSFVKLV